MRHRESKLQQMCVKYFRYRYPNEIIFSIPNGGNRNAITGALLKKEGVLPGVPDLFIAKGNSKYHGMFIEMKYGTNTLTEEQRKVQKKLKEKNYLVEICYSLDEFISAVDKYMSL